MDSAIKVVGVGKRYQIGGQELSSLRETLVARARALFGGNDSRQEEFWALRNVSFDVRPGEVIGIVGKNGAGKSTLLKVLSRITHPTEGRVEINGTVASLLEVGTGFHPELTGRENIFLNGTLLGMQRSEIKTKYDQIVEFSGVGRFIDTPVKHYSSGMYVRLAFAVAAHLEPDILIIDEVLAVGDAEFQKKCLGKMKDIGAIGRTVLFVSHNMQAVRSLCSRAILIRDGSVAEIGTVENVVNSYLMKEARTILEASWDRPEDAPGNQIVRIKRVALKPDGVGEAGEGVVLDVNRAFRLLFDLWFVQSLPAFNLVVNLYSLGGELIFASPSERFAGTPGLHQLGCRIPGKFLNDGYYYVNLQVTGDSKGVYVLEEALHFEIADAEREGAWFGKWPGAVRPYFQWEHKPEA
ncbi:MAG: ABC transporter ATP-binding protein [Fimbriimonadaceae bacterium]|nr:ABC transporter ATP-binding protein [Fimbriimonadaceae bacterium]